MSGQTIQSPSSIDTNIINSTQPVGGITPISIQIVEDSLAGIFSSTQTTSYTLVVADRGTRIRYSSSSPGTFTIPQNVFALNTVVMFCQVGTGQLSIAAGTGVTIVNTSSLTTRTQGSTIWAILDVANTWILNGDLT